MTNPISRLFSNNRGADMTAPSKLEVLRKSHYALEKLPQRLRVPALGDRRNEADLELTDASVDDVAFAILGLEAEFSVVGDRLFALRRLYTLARQEGAFGFERVVDVVLTRSETQ